VIGNDAYIFVKKMLREMKQPEFQMAPYELKVQFAQILYALGACTNIPSWSKGAAARMIERDWLEKRLESLVGPVPEVATTAGAGKFSEFILPAPADLESIANEAMESLYKEGEFVKVLDELGKPKLNETGKQIYRAIEHAKEAELAFYKKEMAPARKPPDPPDLAELRARGALLWPSLQNRRRDDR
jgi:hypothetical protein